MSVTRTVIEYPTETRTVVQTPVETRIVTETVSSPSSQTFDFKIGDRYRNLRYNLPEFPELTIIYIDSVNNLCPSVYSRTSIVCVSKGSLQLTLNVNGQFITLIDGEGSPKTGTRVVTSFGQYEFLPIYSHGTSEDNIFMTVRITKLAICDPASGSCSFKRRTKFKIVLPENATTGYANEVIMSPGLKLVNKTNIVLCEQPGCGSMVEYELVGLQTGTESFKWRNVRSWEDNSSVPYKQVFINIE